MEADIDVIVPVDAGEAQAMIELIEMLFDEWYGARHRRVQRLNKIAEIHADKHMLKRGPMETADENVPTGDEPASGAAALLDK